MSNPKISCSVIITTHNSPSYLRLVLLSLMGQDINDFEVIIADDGSDDEVKKVVGGVAAKAKFGINYIWQPHHGFRAAMIRNKAVALSHGEYLIFLDGDSVPLISFISSHKQMAESGYFVSGNRVLLSEHFTKTIFSKNIIIQKWNTTKWLYAFCRGWINRFLPFISLGGLYWRYANKNKWQGAKTCNLGMWKKDFIAINGFDERYIGWGYEDSDLVVRLMRYGVLRKEGRYGLPVLHLWHLKNDRNNEHENYSRLEKVLSSDYVKIQDGIDKYIGMGEQP